MAGQHIGKAISSAQNSVTDRLYRRFGEEFLPEMREWGFVGDNGNTFYFDHPPGPAYRRMEEQNRKLHVNISGQNNAHRSKTMETPHVYEKIHQISGVVPYSINTGCPSLLWMRGLLFAFFAFRLKYSRMKLHMALNFQNAVPAHSTNGRSTTVYIILTMTTVLLVMTLFEITIQAFVPDITLRQSYIITIIFTTVISGIVAWFVLRQQRSLRCSEQAFRIIADFTYDWEYWLGPDGDLRYTSPSSRRITGYSASEFCANPGLLVSIAHPEDRNLVSAHIRDTTQREPRELEFRIFHRNGELRWIGHACQPVFDRNGVFLGRRASNRDITERKKTEELVSRAEILDQIDDAVIAVDTDSIVRYLNRPAFRQYELDPVLYQPGRKIEDYFTSEWVFPDQQESVGAALRATGTWRGITVHITHSGKRLWVESHVSTIKDVRGKEIGVVAVIRDTTGRKLLEDECTRTSAQLTETNNELEAFSYSVSHDLRNPLTGIRGLADILVEDYAQNLDAESRDYLVRIASEARRMQSLIEDILSLSRVGRQEIVREDIDLSAIVRSYLDELRRSRPDRRVEIIVEEGIHAYADPRLVHLMLENLLRNAWKFTAKREMTRIEFGAMTEGGKRVFYIRDNGTGFDPQYARRIFEPFQRAHTDREYQGSGIGLSIVRRVVSRHGGEIRAEGEMDKGAVFFFTLGEDPEPAYARHDELTAVSSHR